MKYYKVLKDAFDYTTDYELIENELLTEKERIKKAPAISCRNFVIVEINKNNTYFSFGCRFECKPGIHITNHGGKLTGLKSISTSVKLNKTCAKRAKNPNCICSKCYANNYLTMRKALRDHLENNTEILTSEILPLADLPIINDLYFRFESFGELNNATQVINYFNICRKNPKTTFALWTKNLAMVDRAIKQGNEKPENIIIIYSSWNIGIPADLEKIRKHFDFVDKVFTVYDKNECDGVEIQCGKNKCLECKLCYTHNNIEYINEIKK